MLFTSSKLQSEFCKRMTRLNYAKRSEDVCSLPCKKEMTFSRNMKPQLYHHYYYTSCVQVHTIQKKILFENIMPRKR